MCESHLVNIQIRDCFPKQQNSTNSGNTLWIVNLFLNILRATSRYEYSDDRGVATWRIVVVLAVLREPLRRLLQEGRLRRRRHQPRRARRRALPACLRTTRRYVATRHIDLPSPQPLLPITSQTAHKKLYLGEYQYPINLVPTRDKNRLPYEVRECNRALWSCTPRHTFLFIAAR